MADSHGIIRYTPHGLKCDVSRAASPPHGTAGPLDGLSLGEK